jgi:hypothetical protein
LTCYRRWRDYGLNTDPLLLTNLYATQQAVTDLLNSVEDLGKMFRGYWDITGNAAREGFGALTCAHTRGYPVLRMVAQAARLGVGWTDREGGLTTAFGGMGCDVMEGSILSALTAGDESAGIGGYIRTSWEAGVHGMEQVVSGTARGCLRWTRCGGGSKRLVRPPYVERWPRCPRRWESRRVGYRQNVGCRLGRGG